MFLNEVWVTLYICAASREIILDPTPGLDSHSFTKSFHRFISRRGCPSNVISDSGMNFASVGTQEFVRNMGVDWIANLLLSTWQ